jgi:hypothetical protein
VSNAPTIALISRAHFRTLRVRLAVILVGKEKQVLKLRNNSHEPAENARTALI